MSSALPSISLSPLEATLLGPEQFGSRGDSASQAAGLSSSANDPAMRLVDASRTSWTDSPGALLRRRLAAAAIVLAGCLAMLLLRSWWVSDSAGMWLRGVILVHSLGCLVILVGRRSLNPQELRGIELALFVPVGIQLYSLHLNALWEALETHNLTRIGEILQIAAFGFALLMMAYGMFMPNGWKRTAIMLIPPALAPLSIAICGLWFHPWLSEVITSTRLMEIACVPIISAAVACYGARTIATLRHEAKQARKLGQYRLTRELGRGGMGQVYLAEHQLLKRPCAIKVIHPQHVADPHALARFEREVRSTAKLSHWHTVEVYDYGHTDDGTFYYVMEYLPGMNLHDLVMNFGPLPIARAIHFLRQTCAALREAHREGMVHRDLKPANIFAAERGGAYDITKLLDFGLVADPAEGGWEESDSATRNLPFAGSPLYMSPEQAQGLTEPDPRSDIYSLAAVGYFLLTGRPPFEGRSPWRVMQAHVQSQVRPPSQLRADLPPELEAVLLKCLSKNPADRYQDVAEMGLALEQCAAGRIWTFRHAEEWWTTNTSLTDV